MKDKDWTFRCCPWQEAFDGATENDYIYLDPPYIGRDTSYVGEWPEEEAVQLAEYAHGTPANVCLSMWKENEFRKNEHLYLFDAVIEPVPDKGGAYVRFPYDIRKEFGKGRVKAEITFDGEPYSGNIVNMGIKNEDGSVCYIIGVRKDIRAKIGKQPGDTVKITVKAIQP
ncbi:MAG TPA: DUF1905 domain-containing protein [Candidatus Enterenecus stercoripullorum]|nr:DUF1905 domain-containing protein [Candidatus Enterenecus stercoripullorum]